MLYPKKPTNRHIIQAAIFKENNNNSSKKKESHSHFIITTNLSQKLQPPIKSSHPKTPILPTPIINQLSPNNKTTTKTIKNQQLQHLFYKQIKEI